MLNLEGSNWLCSWERDELIARMVAWGLLKWDNNRKLPLKSGGFTDVYVNLRDMRSVPAAIRGIGTHYALAIQRLGVQRFIEVPEAVSPLAGHVSAISNIPLVTVREQEKAGRVTKGLFIGEIRPGELVAVTDDVITDGASKLAALSSLRSAGVKIAAMVVLVDRQQGWKKKLSSAGFGDVPVWSAMTLHDIRKFLIQRGLMQRCDLEVENRNPIIVALDGKSWEEVLPVIDQLRTSGCILKVNDLLWYEGMAKLLPDLSVYGRVMADIKGHDISNTLGNIAKRFAVCPPWAVTIHASGHCEMIEKTRSMLDSVGAKSTKVLAVTVLTSLGTRACEEVYGNQPLDQVLKLAALAARAGADGFVCSAQEVATLKEKYPDKVFVVAGVRSPGADAGDQSRVDTPVAAKANGASYLVMGRQVMEASDPVAEVQRVIVSELNIPLG